MSEETPAHPNGTRYERLLAWHAEKLPRAQMLERLKADGLDDESATVLVNSVIGKLPAELPEAGLTRGTNVLAPNAFSLSDIGLSGPPTVVGLYWLGLGVAMLIALGVAAIMAAAGMVEVPPSVASVLFICLGVFRYSQGITIRRRQ